MYTNLHKEQFSLAYVRAVAAAAGFKVERPEVDDESIDLRISASVRGERVWAPRLECQVKCTTVKNLDADGIRYPLPVKNYNELRGTSFLVPRIFVVVIVPESTDDWVYQDQEQLVLRHCGYWKSLRDAPETDNTESVTVFVPRTQGFTVDSLKGIMEDIGGGRFP